MKKIVLAPYIDQTDRWVNGCESISAVMLLQAMGIRIDPDTFTARTRGRSTPVTRTTTPATAAMHPASSGR